MKVECSLKSKLFRLITRKTARMEVRADARKHRSSREGQMGDQLALWLWNLEAPPHPRSEWAGNVASGCQDSVGGMSEALKQDPAVLNQFSVKRKLTESMSVISVAFKTGLREPPTNMRKHVRNEEIGKWRAQGLKKRDLQPNGDGNPVKSLLLFRFALGCLTCFFWWLEQAFAWRTHVLWHVAVVL